MFYFSRCYALPMKWKIREMRLEDIAAAAQVHEQAFPRQRHSQSWIECNFRAFPRTQMFVAEDGDLDNIVVGYIQWIQKSGFRPEVVLELEQIAVIPACQGNGVGSALIAKSLPTVQQKLAQWNQKLKHLIVTTRADNQAQQLYRTTLAVEVEATLRNLYSADEVIMISRNVEET
jgi:ribosomal protein S18 acetylase RimI-like enzyme